MRQNCKIALLSFVLVGWLGLISVGVFELNQYSYTPGAPESGLSDWPAKSSLIRQSDGRPTVVMFLHPKCPCSRASVDELANLQTETTGLAKVVVLFLKPESWSTAEVEGELWKTVSLIPGVERRLYTKGTDASLFGAKTSGQVLVFDGEGQKVFSGGITAGRGEKGRSAGRNIISSYLKTGELERGKQLPVFGCSLLERHRS